MQACNYSFHCKIIISTPVGSRHQPYRLAIVGCGPAGTAIAVRAIQLGFDSELLSDLSTNPVNDDQQSDRYVYGGLCMFDKGEAVRFGGGRLQDYMVE